MTAKEKAKKIISKFIDHVPTTYYFEHQKQCALICVDEILSNGGTEYHNKFWQNVKKEINKL